ncbi:enoyl-CoA hydratase-related protein [Nocardia brevicatena]|uniref:enoyl-CoA hydratase-related protein n=1 Tax=Nocardia brevicatena TaxID=37327 RepID=UPI0002FA29B8|nr:enoyl-CoA hydratase-related protein [Nocardia brevicatena]
MSTPTTDPVLVESAAGLVTITLARAEAANALNTAVKEALLAAVRKVGEDSTARAVLLRAEGKHFCVGQDLAEHADALRAGPGPAMSTIAEHYNPLITALAELDIPVIAAVNGACVGAGLGLALAADIRVAADNATFATAFTGIGLASDSGLSHALTRSLGAGRAAGLLLLGDKITAEQAESWGLVHRRVPATELAQTARTIAARLAAGPTAAYRAVKDLIRHSDDELDGALERERAVQEELGATDDHRNAVAAFLDKTTPVFTGR